MFFLNRTRDLYHSDDIFSMSFSPYITENAHFWLFLVKFSNVFPVFPHNVRHRTLGSYRSLEIYIYVCMHINCH
jgi:hypothetical protein